MRPSRYLSWLRRQILPDLVFCAGALALFVGFIMLLPYEQDKQAALYPTEYRIGMVALEEARYVKAEIGRDDINIIDFRGDGLARDYYTYCPETEAEPDAAKSDAAEEPHNECKDYPAAGEDIVCAKDAAAQMKHAPEGIDGSAFLLAIMAVESLARGRVAREVEFLLFDSAGVVGWQPDFSLGRGQIRVSTAARILASAGRIKVDYATARDYLADDCKTLFLMARYLDELFAERAAEMPVDEAFRYAIARYNGQRGRSISGRMYTSVVTRAYAILTGELYARMSDRDDHDEDVLHNESISFQPAETALDLNNILRLQAVVQQYKRDEGTIVLIKAHSDGIGPPDYQQSLIQMRADEIRRWLLRLGALEADIRIAPLALDRLSQTGASQAAVAVSNRRD